MSKNNEQTARVNLIINGQSANAQLRDLEAAARKVKSELHGLHPNSAKFKETAANYKKINDELIKTKVQAGLARSSWDRMKETITSTFIGTLGSNLAASGLQTMVGYIADAWENAKKLSDQFADIRKTTGMTRLEVFALNKELGKMDTRTSMSDLREIAKIGGQFGVAKNELLGFVQAVDRTTIALGDEFKGGAEEVATEMSKLRNILQDIKSDDIGTDIGFISNAINVLASEGIATGPVVADLTNRIGGYGSQVGLASGQVLGLSATLQELNVSAERGGTAVVKILQKMLTNSNEFAKIAGMELRDFEKLLNEDIYGAFVKVMEGSKNLGQNSTLLAGIIKDLEVQGAGASEVFAKLGANTDLLRQKVDIASKSLTNLNSITAESELRNDNLAGSAAGLSKRYEKLMSSSALQGFFRFFVDLAERTLFYVDKIFTTIQFKYRLFTKGLEETNKIYTSETKALLEDQNKAQDAAMKTRVQGYKNGLQIMTQGELAAEKTRLENLVKFNIEFIKIQRKKGRDKQAEITMENAHETRLQLDALNLYLQSKSTKTLSEKRKLTNEELKLEQKKQSDASRIIEKAKKERESFEKSRLEYEYKLWEEKMYQQIEDMKILDEMAATMLENETDRLKKSVENNKKTKEEKIAIAQDIAMSIENIGQSFVNRQNTLDRNELNAEKKKNDEKRRMLKQRLDSGKISQEQYDKQIESIALAEEQREQEMQRKAMEREKKIALFNLSIRMLIAGARALTGDPAAIAEFIASGVAAGAVAATPLPEFYDGGYTPNMGSGVDGKGGFKAILHPKEYVINARQMANPFVYNFTKQLEENKTGSQNNTVTGATGASPIIVQSDPELKELLLALKNQGVKGVWDWDYENRTKERMAELDNRRKL